MSEYTIRSLKDFHRVPADRLHDCLAEFEESVKLMNLMMETMDLPLDKAGIEYFTWKDDGKKDIAQSFKFGEDVIRLDVKERED